MCKSKHRFEEKSKRLKCKTVTLEEKVDKRQTRKKGQHCEESRPNRQT
jgi:hypothetical protein